MKNKLLNLLILIMCMNLIFMPSIVFATTAGGAWSQESVIREGARSIYNGIKKSGDTVMRGVYSFTPNVAQVTKQVIRLGATGAVVTALDQLLQGVDYVMLEENNRVIFMSKEPKFCYMMGSPCFATAEEAEVYVRAYYDKFWNGKPYTLEKRVKANGDIDFVATGKYSDGRDDVRIMPYYWDKKKVTAEQVAAQVISNAEKDELGSKRLVADVADSIVTEQDKRVGWDSTATVGTGTATGTNTGENTGTKVGAVPGESTGTNTGTGEATNTGTGEATADPTEKELPAFCGWAPIVCDTAGKVSDGIDWAKSEPELKDEPTKIDVVDTDIGDWRQKANTSYIQGSNSCPADVSIPINWMSIHSEIRLSYQPFCRFAIIIKPAVIMGAWISGLMIITGGRTKE